MSAEWKGKFTFSQYFHKFVNRRITIIFGTAQLHKRDSCGILNLLIKGFIQERQVLFVSIVAAIGVLGGLTIIAVIVVVAAVTVTVAGAFNSIKDEDAVE